MSKYSDEHQELFSLLPNTLKVGSLYYSLTLDSGNPMSERGPLGMTDNDELSVVARMTGNISQDVNTVIHEIMHCIFHSENVLNPLERENTSNMEIEEKAVIGVTNGFLAVLYDNSEFRQWLVDSIAAVSGDQIKDIKVELTQHIDTGLK